jgi:hypothetical protein
MKIIRAALALVFAAIAFPCGSQISPELTTGDTGVVVDREKLAWELAKKKDRAGLAELLSEDFTEITEDGIYDKVQILDNLDHLTLTGYSQSGFKAKQIAPDAVLLIYQATVNGNYDDHGFQGSYNAASLWVKRNGKWQNVLFQETPVPK